uniref:Uncharacterized protein LOC108950579 n=1 Tax=Phallusia mammillata TaxID=59560 RepID=A0A6F9DK35_9ASCI|nr:uncharacterized protein LOC108950579 [Phallusia mammillata]
MVAGDDVCYLAPSEIRFSQDTVAANFQNGGSINELINKIGCGYLKVEDIPTIKVKTVDEKYYSEDNRRLYVFRVLQKQGKINSIPVHLVKHLPEVKLTTKNDGRSVQVRGGHTEPHTFKTRTRPCKQTKKCASTDRNYRNACIVGYHGNTSTRQKTSSQNLKSKETVAMSSSTNCDETVSHDDVKYYYNDSAVYQSYRKSHYDYEAYYSDYYHSNRLGSSRSFLKDSSDSGGWSFKTKLMIGIGGLALAWYLVSKIKQKITTYAPIVAKAAKEIVKCARPFVKVFASLLSKCYYVMKNKCYDVLDGIYYVMSRHNTQYLLKENLQYVGGQAQIWFARFRNYLEMLAPLIMLL